MVGRIFTLSRYLVFSIIFIWNIPPIFANCSDLGRNFNGDPDLKVSIAILSGRRDREWTITSAENTYQEIKDKLIRHAGSQLASRLGYSGFVVRTVPVDGSDTIFCTVSRYTNEELELLLLNSAPSEIKAIIGTVREELERKIRNRQGSI